MCFNKVKRLHMATNVDTHWILLVEH